uniref:Uncharacterized protein n=1 Tax=Arundo donax TaxID=35708 RepID=A0A0A8ZP43_ARUDO
MSGEKRIPHSINTMI